MSAVITEADRETAQDILDDNDVAYLDSIGIASILAPAIAQAIADARDAENRACEEIAAHEESIGTGTAEFISTRIRGAIAARRTP